MITRSPVVLGGEDGQLWDGFGGGVFLGLGRDVQIKII